jgi:hypothetical protein
MIDSSDAVKLIGAEIRLYCAISRSPGEVTGDHHTEGEGKKDQAASIAKKAGENINDAFRN